MSDSAIDNILSQVAKNNHTTVDEVRKELIAAMELAKNSTDPNAKANWTKMPCKGVEPTLEEFLCYLILQANS